MGRGAAEMFLSSRCWGREALSEMAGDDQAFVSPIPYGQDFGSRDPSVQVTLSRFLEVEARLFAPSGAPYYYFAAVDDVSHPRLASLLRETLGLPEQLPAPFASFHVTELQFALGDAGSGSPMHFHHDAINILLSGRKRWWLVPPALAAMSRTHPQACAATADAEAGSTKIVNGLVMPTEVIQEPGDILYIPDLWGHAVLNLEDTTVAAAVEFS